MNRSACCKLVSGRVSTGLAGCMLAISGLVSSDLRRLAAGLGCLELSDSSEESRRLCSEAARLSLNAGEACWR